MENSLQEDISAAEADVNTSPSEAQKEAGNYKKGHVRIDGFDVSIEQPKGSVRLGTDAGGKQWEQVMNNTYGYLRGTEGVDGDHIDVFLSDDPSQGDVFVVDQVNRDGSFDEHKVMYGFADEESARQAYLANYEDGWTGLGAITRVSRDEFRKWVESSHRKTKPFAEYKGVKTQSPIPLLDAVRTLYSKGKEVASQLFGMKFFDVAKTPDFMKKNEKDKGNNIPLTDEDILNLVDVLNQPDGILFGIDKRDGRKLFFFLKDAGNGLYNLTEVCSTKKGNLTAKSFFKTRKVSTSELWK